MKAVVLKNGQIIFENNYKCEFQSNANSNLIEVEVLQAGICETDLQLVQGYMGFTGVLGHEFVGVAKTGKFAGLRVAGEINCACNQCSYCQKGLRNHCPHRTVVGILNHDGAFAERVWIPEENLHWIPESVTNDEAVFIEPLAAAFQIPVQVNLEDYQHVVILGDGRLGNLCAQVIHSQNSSLLVVGKHPGKLSLLQNHGINTVLLDDLNGEATADLVIDCSGSRSGLETALGLVRPRGTIVMKSTFAGEHGPNLAALVIHEVNLIGSRCGPFHKAIQALESRTISVNELITSRFPLEDALVAFEAARQKDQLKVILDIASQ